MARCCVVAGLEPGWSPATSGRKVRRLTGDARSWQRHFSAAHKRLQQRALLYCSSSKGLGSYSWQTSVAPLSSVILVPLAEPTERLWIVAHDYRVDVIGDRGLPCNRPVAGCARTREIRRPPMNSGYHTAPDSLWCLNQLTYTILTGNNHKDQRRVAVSDTFRRAEI